MAIETPTSSRNSRDGMPPQNRVQPYSTVVLAAGLHQASVRWVWIIRTTARPRNQSTASMRRLAGRGAGRAAGTSATSWACDTAGALTASIGMGARTDVNAKFASGVAQL